MEQSVSSSSKPKTPSYAWVILLVVFLASFTVPLNMFKVPPIAPMLFGVFGLDPSTFGWLMSAFQVMGIILAFPAAGLVIKFGLKPATIVAVSCCAVGSLIGTFAPNAAVLIASRLVEGAGMAFIGVVAPAALSAWFPKERMGLAIGLWGVWMPLGSALMFNLAPAIAGDGNWQAVWWFSTIFSICALVLFIILFRMPKANEMAGGPAQQGGPEGGAKPKIWTRQAIIGIVLLAVMFTFFNICHNGTINSYFATFLQEEHLFDPASAGFVTSIFSFLAIVASPIAGIVSDKLGTRKWIIVVALALMTVAFWFAFSFTSEVEMWVTVAVLGIFSAAVATCTMSFVPDIARNPAAVGLGMSALVFANGLGSFLGGMALGWLLPSFGWATGSQILLIPLMLIALVAVLLIKTAKQDKSEE